MEHRKCLECGDLLKGRIDKNSAQIIVETLTIITLIKTVKTSLEILTIVCEKTIKFFVNLILLEKQKWLELNYMIKGSTFSYLPLFTKQKQETPTFIYTTRDIWA